MATHYFPDSVGMGGHVGIIISSSYHQMQMIVFGIYNKHPIGKSEIAVVMIKVDI